MKSIKATSISLKDFFLAEDALLLKEYVSPRLLVPSFQRNYAWNKKHVNELIESINENEKDYFIGNILVQDMRNQDLIIDGQQRITTILLIIKALEPKLNASRKKLASKILFYNFEKNLLRVEFTRKNLLKSFKKIIIDNDFDESNFEDDNSKKFLKNFFNIKEVMSNIENANTFFDKVINLVFVVIRFDEGFNVNQLFEGLNSKGKPLSAVQLTKNALLGSINDDSYVDTVVEVWEKMESSYEKEKAAWFDKFLRHFGFYKYNYVSENGLFKKIKKDIETNDAIIFSKELSSDAELYIKIRTNTLFKKDISVKISDVDWNVISSIVKNFSYSELEQVYGVLFACFKYAKTNENYSKGVNSHLLVDVKKIWSFAILTKYLGTNPSKFETAFANFSGNLGSGNYKSSRKLFSSLNAIVINSSKEEFIENLNNRIKITGESENKVNSKNNRSYVSQLLFCYLTDGKEFLLENCTIEHIIPKGKTDGLVNWTIGKKFINDVSKRARFKLGNLTLLVSGDDLGNSSFNIKLPRYQSDKFKKNSDIAHYTDLFTSLNPAKAVDKRGYKMAEELYVILCEILKK